MPTTEERGKKEAATRPPRDDTLFSLCRWRFDQHYGPAECTVLCTFSTLESNDPNPPIGRALSNTQLYVLDARKRPVPVGVPGELFIAGAGVSAGRVEPRCCADRHLAQGNGALPAVAV